MTAICSSDEYEMIVEHYGRQQATISHGKNPITGDYDHKFSLYNVTVRTKDVDKFERLGGSRLCAKAHGYDTHPNMRR